MSHTGAAAVLQALEHHGVERVFGYPGGCIMPLYDALLHSPVEHVLCRHEQGCALAADGYARAGGGLGVAVATSGPGATNLITGVANAYMDSVPMLVITGQVAGAVMGTDAFQEADVLGLSLGVTKHSYLVTEAEALPGVMAEAISLATSGRPGPVWIDVTKDALAAPLEADPIPPGVEHRAGSIPPDPAALAEARHLLARARRPLVYAGGGVVLAGAVPAFRDFLAATGVPCVETLKGIGNAGADYSWNLGLLGMHGSRAANQAVEVCDLLICIGARFDDRATGRPDGFAPRARVIHLDADAAEQGKIRRAEVALGGDMAATLAGLSQPLHIAGWRDHCAALLERGGFAAPAMDQVITGPALLSALSDHLPLGAVVTCDVGQHQMWVAQYMRFGHPAQHLSSGGLGTMGYGLPAAVGAGMARPGATVVNITGDGSFLINVQELATLSRYRLPVKIVVLDNSHLGLVRQQQELFYQRRYSECALDDNPDFTRVAAAFGLASRRLERPADRDEALAWLLAQPGPALLHVPIETTANVWPMVPPGAANTEMMEA